MGILRINSRRTKRPGRSKIPNTSYISLSIEFLSYFVVESSSIFTMIRWKSTNPSYVNSFGDVKCEQVHGHGLLRFMVWFVSPGSEVDNVWSRLLPSLHSLIQESQATLQSQQEGPLSSPPYALEGYLIGPTKSHAAPYVCVLSPAKWHRKAICKLLKQSALLDQHGFECRGVHGDPQACTMNLRLSNDQMKDYHLRVNYSSSEHSVNGAVIEIYHGGTAVGMATLGGVVDIEGQLLGMTVRHAFLLPNTSGTTHEARWDRISATDGLAIRTFELDSEESDDELDHESQDHHVQGRPFAAGSEAMNDSNSRNLESSRDHVADTSLLTIARELPNYTAMVAPDSELDWALIQIPDLVPNKQFSEPSTSLSTQRIQIKTPNQLLEANLGAKGLFGIHNILAPQIVMVASVPNNTGPEPGSSGSWAMEMATGNFVGMLIGSCPSLGSVYILSIEDIINDINQHIARTPTLPTLPAELRTTQNIASLSTAHQSPLPQPHSWIPDVLESTHGGFSSPFSSEDDFDPELILSGLINPIYSQPSPESMLDSHSSAYVPDDMCYRPPSDDESDITLHDHSTYGR
jgi:hypothetical protein